MHRYRSSTGDEIRVVTTTGHVAIVGDEWRELPAIYHQAAVQAGCEVDTPTKAATPTRVLSNGNDAKNIDELIERALKTMLEREVADDFTSAGEPNLNVVSKLAGMKVKREQVTAIYHRLKEEAGGEGDGADEGNDD